MWTSHAVLRAQHRRGPHGMLQVWREWARAAPSPAGAALPSSGPRWRCAPSVSPAPAGIRLQLPDPWPREATVSLPQLPLPASLLHQLSPSPLTGVPPSLMGVTTVRPQDGPNLLPPKMLLPHSLPQSDPGSRLAQMPGKGVGGLPGTLPCQASPSLLLQGGGDLSTPCTANKTSTRLQRPRQHISAALQGGTEAGSERG